MPDENRERQSDRSTDRTRLDSTVLVHTSVEPSSRQPTASSSVRQIVTVASLFERGLRYDGINTARSAISAITEPKHGLTLGSQPLISRFMKGVFRSRPPVARYEATSDVQVVLSNLASFAPVKKKKNTWTLNPLLTNLTYS